MLMFMGIEHVGGCPCPRNLLFVRDDMSVHSALMNAHRLGGIAIAAGVVTVVVRRWQSASPLLRRALAPILVTGGMTTALLAAMLIADQASAGITTSLQSAERVALATVPLAYLFGLFQTRLARVGIGELVVELGNSPEQGRLRDALARALRDPSLELGYWMPASQEYVDVDGKQVDVVPTATRAVTILERRGRESRGARPRRCPPRGPRPARRSLQRRRSRARQRAPPRASSEPSSRRPETHERASSTPPTPSGGDSSATSTTAPNSASSPSPCTCAWPRKPCATTRRPPERCSTASAKT